MQEEINHDVIITGSCLVVGKKVQVHRKLWLTRGEMTRQEDKKGGESYLKLVWE